MDLFLTNEETNHQLVLTRKDIEGLFQVFLWRKDREIDFEEFKLLVHEWHKTTKLLTSGNFFLNIAHQPEIFEERDFYSIVRDSFEDSKAKNEFLWFVLNTTETMYKEKVTTTPFLGYDLEKNAIYSLEDSAMTTLEVCYRLIDSPGRGVGLNLGFKLVTIHSLSTVFFTLKQIDEENDTQKFHKPTYLSWCKDLVGSLDRTNLKDRILFSKRECMNLLIKLINRGFKEDRMIIELESLFIFLKENYSVSILAKICMDATKSIRDSIPKSRILINK